MPYTCEGVIRMDAALEKEKDEEKEAKEERKRN